MKLITIDIDEKMRPCKFLEYAADCRFILSVLGYSDRDNKTLKIWETRRGLHVSFWLPQVESNVDLIMIQLFLGSDRKREAFNLRREQMGKFRSYLFDAKITKDGSFVNERAPIYEAVWNEVFSLSQEDFEKQYQEFQKNKYKKVEKNGEPNTGKEIREARKSGETKENNHDGIREANASPSRGISGGSTPSRVYANLDPPYPYFSRWKKMSELWHYVMGTKIKHMGVPGSDCDCPKDYDDRGNRDSNFIA